MNTAPLPAVAPIVARVNVGVLGGFTQRNACVPEIFNKDAGTSVKQVTVMWLANASDSIEVVQPGKGRLTDNVVVSVRQSV